MGIVRTPEMERYFQRKMERYFQRSKRLDKIYGWFWKGGLLLFFIILIVSIVLVGLGRNPALSLLVADAILVPLLAARIFGELSEKNSRVCRRLEAEVRRQKHQEQTQNKTPAESNSAPA